MSKVNCDELRLLVAQGAMSGIKQYALDGQLPDDVDDTLVLEGLLLCMQMMCGPRDTATVVRYSFVMVADK